MNPNTKVTCRGYLPHVVAPGSTQFVTWRLADALSLEDWQAVEAQCATEEVHQRARTRAKLTEHLLDQGLGEAYLSSPECAEKVIGSVLHWQGKGIWVHTFVVMPNHVHALVTLEGLELSAWMKSVKSFSAKGLNQIRCSQGRVWMRESYDRMIRTPEQFDRTKDYIELNPVKAGLAAAPEDYAWSSAHPSLRDRVCR